MDISFTVINNTGITNEVVVVQPQIADLDVDAALREWRVLTPGPLGGSSAFRFAGAVSAVVSAGGTSTAAQPIAPGTILPVVSSPNGGLNLGDPAGGGDAGVCSVRNDSQSTEPLTVTWLVDGAAVLSEGGLNQQSIATLELTGALAFHVRSATVQKLVPSTALVIASPPSLFTVLPAMQEVTVTWTRHGTGGSDTFHFVST